MHRLRRAVRQAQTAGYKLELGASLDSPDFGCKPAFSCHPSNHTLNEVVHAY
jgi:hypothetical protein